MIFHTACHMCLTDSPTGVEPVSSTTAASIVTLLTAFLGTSGTPSALIDPLSAASLRLLLAAAMILQAAVQDSSPIAFCYVLVFS